MQTFGDYVRTRREALKQSDTTFSVRQVAQRIGVEPSFLSKVERNEVPPPGEEKIVAIARELSADSDLLLAMAGKVSTDLKAAIMKRPELFAGLIRELNTMPDRAVLRLVREVRDGKW